MSRHVVSCLCCIVVTALLLLAAGKYASDQKAERAVRYAQEQGEINETPRSLVRDGMPPGGSGNTKLDLMEGWGDPIK